MEIQEFFSKLRDRCQGYTELVLRIVAGVFILSHGFGKVNAFPELFFSFPDPLGIGSGLSLSLAVFAEFICALFFIVGLFTRFAALNLLITMLVAGLIFHALDPFAKKELALLYAVVFFYFTVVGGNTYSLDYWIRKRWLL